MTTLRVSIRDEHMALVEALVAEGRYGSPDEVVQALLDREDRRRRGELKLKAKIQEALDSGPAELMTDADWIAMRQEAIDGLAGESIRP
jgi:putative addiction module CopG family antidote